MEQNDSDLIFQYPLHEQSFINYKIPDDSFWGNLSGSGCAILKEFEFDPTSIAKLQKEKKNLFIISKNRKRGRQIPYNPNKKIHSSDLYDNIKIKIKRHYISYLIGLANDAVKCILLNESNIRLFLDIISKRKIQLFKPNELQVLKYKDIFSFEVSKKNKGKIKDGQTNEETYFSIINKSPLLKEFFDQSYLDVLEKYYYKDLRKINFKGQNITLSEKTKTFSNLLDKDNNRIAKDRFEFIINNVFINNESD